MWISYSVNQMVDNVSAILNVYLAVLTVGKISFLRVVLSIDAKGWIVKLNYFVDSNVTFPWDRESEVLS